MNLWKTTPTYLLTDKANQPISIQNAFTCMSPIWKNLRLYKNSAEAKAFHFTKFSNAEKAVLLEIEC